MLFVLIALWTAGTLLLVSDPASARARWLSGVSFSGGFGALAALLDEYAVPYAIAHDYGAGSMNVLTNAVRFCSLISYHGMPYTFAMFAIRYHQAWPLLRRARLLALWLALPSALCLLFIRPIYPIPYSLVVLWAAPYALIGAALILTKREAMRSLRRNHLVTAIAVVPTVLFATAMNYVLPVFGIFQMWRYNTWIIAFAFLVFVYSIFRFGFMGIQLLIQRRRLDFTLRAITSGTAILNHAIKNDVGKMKLFSDKIHRYAEQTGQQELADDILVVMAASQHIQDMITRVHGQTQELALRNNFHRPAELIVETLHSLEPSLNGIQTHIALDDVPELWCDRVQIGEVLANVIMNAAEAMAGGGELCVKLYNRKGQTVIEVRDTGEGMDGQRLKQAIEPFFTTKTNTKSGHAGNFGLGLAYCYNVMKKHGGSLELTSKPGQGTTVYMEFPKARKGIAHGQPKHTHLARGG